MTKLQLHCSLAAEQLLSCSIEINFLKVSATGRSQGFEGMRYMDGQTVIAWPLSMFRCSWHCTINVWARIGEKHLAPSCIACGRGGVSTRYFHQIWLGIEHLPSLCVLCSPCYSRWCHGQILAIPPRQSMHGRE